MKESAGQKMPDFPSNASKIAKSAGSRIGIKVALSLEKIFLGDLMISFVTSSEFISDSLGSIAVVMVLVWPLFSERGMVLLIQCIGTGAFALYFVLIGSETAAATSCIALVQLLAAALVPSRLQLWLIYGASGIVLVCATMATWNGLPSVFASIGSLLAMVARLQQSTTFMKAGFLVSAPFWALHNFIVGSVFGLTVDVVSTTSIIVALCRIGFRTFRTNWRQLMFRKRSKTSVPVILRTSVTINESEDGSDFALAPCGDVTQGGGIPRVALRQYAGRHDRHAGDSE